MKLSCYHISKRRVGKRKLTKVLDLVLKFPCSVLDLDVDVHNYRPLLMQAKDWAFQKSIFLVRILRVCKSDKIIREVFSSKCKCLGSNQRRHEYREVFLLFSGLGLFGLKLNKKEDVFLFLFFLCILWVIKLELCCQNNHSLKSCFKGWRLSQLSQLFQRYEHRGHQSDKTKILVCCVPISINSIIHPEAPILVTLMLCFTRSSKRSG